jgi:antitoxin MazE
VKVDIIRIGNSQGVRIPRPLLEQCGLQGRVEMDVKDGKLVIGPARTARTGWSDAFREMAEAGDDRPLFQDTEASDWDEAEWRW